MTSTIPIYRGMGLSIPYPESWRVTEDGKGTDTQSVLFESTETAFMSVSICSDCDDPMLAIEEATEGMESDYDDIEVEDTSVAVELDGIRCRELRFYYLDMVVLSRLISFRHNGSIYLMQQQAEDREFVQIANVFAAMVIGMSKAMGQ